MLLDLVQTVLSTAVNDKLAPVAGRVVVVGRRARAFGLCVRFKRGRQLQGADASQRNLLHTLRRVIGAKVQKRPHCSDHVVTLHFLRDEGAATRRRLSRVVCASYPNLLAFCQRQRCWVDNTAPMRRSCHLWKRPCVKSFCRRVFGSLSHWFTSSGIIAALAIFVAAALLVKACNLVQDSFTLDADGNGLHQRSDARAVQAARALAYLHTCGGQR